MDKPSPAFHTKEYDAQIKRTLPYYEEFFQQAADIAAVLGKEKLSWLDVGCGTGKMAETAMGHLNIDRFVFCDNSAEMLDIARHKFPLPNAEFLLKPAQELAYTNEFDVITAIQVNHYFQQERRAIAIKNYYRALKNGGIFISFENFAPLSPQGKEILLNRWKKYQINSGRSPQESQTHIDRYGTAYFPITIPEHLEILHQCGFQTAEVIWVSCMQAGFLGIKQQ